MTRFSATVLASVIGAATLGGAQDSSPRGWEELTARLERATLAGASKDLRAIRIEILKRLATPAEQPREPLLRYAVAYAGWRMSTLPDVPQQEQDGLLEDAINHLQASVKSAPDNADAHALLGSVYGLQIGRSPIKGMLLGPRASRSLDRAAKAEPANPRVLLLQGVSAYNTPAMFGGDLGDAERLLRRSLEVLSREPADKPWPNWGRFDAHVWLGQTLLKKGDKAGARAEYDKALAIAPDSGWLRYALIPALDRAGR